MISASDFVNRTAPESDLEDFRRHISDNFNTQRFVEILEKYLEKATKELESENNNVSIREAA